MSLLRRAAIALPFAGVGAAAAWCLQSDAASQRAASLYLIPVRLSRDVIAASSILAGTSWRSDLAPCAIEQLASLTRSKAILVPLGPLLPCVCAQPSLST